MSVGPFICGMRRFDKHKIANDKPTNQVLHNEQQQKLSELLRLREQQDKGTFTSITVTNKVMPTVTNTVTNTATNESYTPWKTPSSTFTS